MIDLIKEYIERQKIVLPTGLPTIVYVENVLPDWTPIDGIVGDWDDQRCLIDFDAKTPTMEGQWAATVQYGREAMLTKSNGAAKIALGWHPRKWRMGFHKQNKSHPALVQVAGLSITRDVDRNGKPEGDPSFYGIFGLNQHTTGVNPPTQIGPWSYGCLVGQVRQGHFDYLGILRRSPAFKKDPNMLFSTLIINPKKLPWIQ